MSPVQYRITVYLRRAASPRHYRAIARHLNAPLLATHRACWRMAHTGRLRWCGEGLYRLPQPEDTP